MEAKVRTASDLAGGVEVSVQGGGCQVTAVLGRKQQGIRFVAHMAAQVLLDRPEMLVLDRNSVLSVYGDVQIATSTDFYFGRKPDISISKPRKVCHI